MVKIRLLALVLFSVSFLASFAQNCAVTAQYKTVCLGSSDKFSVSFDNGFTPISYSWNFGNNVTNTQASPIYIYPNYGKFAPQVTVQFTGGKSCTVLGDSIYVSERPRANLIFQTGPKLCFKDNVLLVADSSLPGRNGPPITSHRFFWDDGTYDTTLADFQTYSHNYTSPLGGLYSVSVELIDANNCITRLEKTDSVRIYPKLPKLEIKSTFTTQCFNTPVTFYNTSAMAANQVKRYCWNFGDTTVIDTDIAHWSGTSHVYSKGGYFNPLLWVEDLNGCQDTFILYNGARNVRFGTQIDVNYTNKCHDQQDYKLTLQKSEDVEYSWQLFDFAGKQVYTSDQYEFKLNTDNIPCGVYRAEIFARFGQCSQTADTTIELLGPDVHLHTKKIWPTHYTQCTITDSVLFINPNPDFSCYYKANVMRMWNFNDPFAPACTLDTKNGINLGLNCNYTVDATNVRHWYTPGKELCYKPSLYMIDPVSTCYDSDTVGLSLMAPKANMDTFATPKRLGLIVSGKPCLNSAIQFDISQTQPSCNRTAAWILPDSAAAQQLWLKVDTNENTKRYVYRKITDPAGNVTIGVIIQNGDCYDTAWYHNMLKFLPMNAGFNVKVKGNCQPYGIELIPNDTIQDSILYCSWILNNVVRKTQNFDIGDSIVHRYQFNDSLQGYKTISFYIQNTMKCAMTHDTLIRLGYQKSFTVNRQIQCLGSPFKLNEQVSYFNDTTNYWAKPGRPETLSWKVIGDTVTLHGSHPSWTPLKHGNFSVKMITSDSNHCVDSFTYPFALKVVEPFATIRKMQQVYVCAPKTVVFLDSSYEFDIHPSDQPADDSVAMVYWNFGDGSPLTNQFNPVHKYNSNDTFHVELIAVSALGCLDTAREDILFLGPHPSFKLIRGDTVGCPPVEIELANTTGRLITNFIWSSNGPDSKIVSSQTLNNAVFNYTKPGLYEIMLTGEEVVTNPLNGVRENCLAIFPDTSKHKFTLQVFDKVKTKLSVPDSVCLGQVFNAVASAPRYPMLYHFVFDNIENQTNPKDSTMHWSFNSLGQHQVELLTQYNISPSCNDTQYHSMYVTQVKAKFTDDISSAPRFSFTNASENAQFSKWLFYNPKFGTIDSSTHWDASYTFKQSPDSVMVCLFVQNSFGCGNSMCKKYYVFDRKLNIPNVFTPNGDGLNEAFDVEVQAIDAYELTVYNRWGDVVYFSETDGTGNDGINWNGKLNNTGANCPDGVYFYVFRFRWYGTTRMLAVNGTVSLMRE